MVFVNRQKKVGSSMASAVKPPSGGGDVLVGAYGGTLWREGNRRLESERVGGGGPLKPHQSLQLAFSVFIKRSQTEVDYRDFF